jgi:hypothetical protein
MKNKIIKIISVTYLHDYILKINFLDGKVCEVNFFNFLNSSTNPDIKSFLDINKFKSYTLKNGELMWGDFDLLFPIQDLYRGQISA